MEVYGRIVETGPNASTSCGSARSGSPTSRIGETKAPRSASASSTSTRSGSPNTIRPASARALTLRRTSSRCSRLASAPIRADAGSPTVTFASRAEAASTTASTCSAGTNARRIAVHFWPAFTVISVVRPFTKRSNSSVPGTASGPSAERLSESASAENRTEFRTIAGCARRVCAVDAEPVNATRSWPVRWSNMSPTEPATNCHVPSGSSPESTISSVSRAVRNAVGLAGLTTLGTPARNAGANFSSGPHTGKLNALTCTATPCSGVQTCWPRNVPPRPSGSTAPST